MNANPDPPARPFIPDPQLVALAHNDMLEAEDEGSRFVRQRWEEAFAAVRVGMQALREIYPSQLDALTDTAGYDIREALEHLTSAFVSLDGLSEEMLGADMVAVLRGQVTSVEDLRRRLGLA